MIIMPPVRGWDMHGNGSYLAPRGNRKHNGIDYACYQGSIILSQRDGKVTKIGYPYDPDDPVKGHLRYVQITDEEDFDARYFYVEPTVELWTDVYKGQPIGKTQGLLEVYPGITDHFHFEIIKDGEYVNPEGY